MWSRQELKERAKIAFKRNYWKCVLVAFILSVLTGSGAANSTSNLDTDEIIQKNYHYEDGYYYEQESVVENVLEGVVTTGLVAIGMTIALVSIILSIFVLNPLEIGGCHFFTNNTYMEATPWDLVAGFKNGRYWSSVATVFLRNLFIALWSLLLVIPGIIKSYEYRMVTYLMAEYPNMTREEAFRISKEMMAGQKMDAFVLDLSFFGWYLLTAVTCGIAGIFYVSPYVHATNAELYVTLRNQYFYSNSTTKNFYDSSTDTMNFYDTDSYTNITD